LTGVAVGGASDGNLTAGVGTPTLDGLGAVGGGAHADDEHVLVEELPGRAALVAELAAELLAGSEPHAPSAPTNRLTPSGRLRP
jgi:glutamate carboxypeptidase